MDFKITRVKAREILDSRGSPTIEVDIFAGNIMARAAVPSGASTGIHEALELRDKGKRYFGKGVLKAVKNVRLIGKKIKGMDPLDQKALDEYMIHLDGTENKSKFGANAILGISMANTKLAAKIKQVPLYKHISQLAKTKPKLPTPFFNIINGGKHADNKLSFQEFMIAPIKIKSFKNKLRAGSEIYHILKKEIHAKYGKGTTNVGDEGGFAPQYFKNVKEPLEIITKSIKDAGYEGKVKIAMDVAASEFFENENYNVDGQVLNSKLLHLKYKEIVKNYPVISIEDPFQEDDFDSTAKLTNEIGKKVQIVGDDLLVTNVNRIRIAIEKKSCNALLLKVNQIGTVTEAINAAKLAMKNNWKVMVSHRSGETSDSFIADLVVGLGTGQIKSGAPCRSERLAKYNQLLRIEEEL